MISRRDFGLMSAGAGLSLLTVGETNAQGITTMRLANASGVIDSQVIFMTVGMNPKVGYYAAEKVAMEVTNMSGAAQTMQAVATGNVEISPIGPPLFLNAYMKAPNIDVVFVYNWLRQCHWGIGVKPDSPIKQVAELKGKKIAIRNQGDTGYFGARAMLKELKIDPDKDVEWVSVGDGGPAGDAVYKSRADALALWDGAFARVEIAGFPMRYLPNTDGMKHLFGNGYAVRKSEFAKNKEVLIRFFRAMAMGTVFAYANPEASIRLAWEVYPETKPKGKSDEESMRESLVVVNSRKDKWFPGAWAKDKRFGAFTKEEWEAQVKFADLEDKIKDVTAFYSNDLIDEINKFDPKPIIERAKSFKL